jgi:hypothetical protein
MRALHVSALLILTSSLCYAQVSIPTRWTVGGQFTLAQPKEAFAQNIGNGYGGGGEVIYHVVRSGLLSLRTDVSAVSYGSEKKRVPFSGTVPRVQLDVRTNNSIVALTWGPEVARPSGRFRPYAHAGYSRLFFRTTSSVRPTNSAEENLASSTNHKDGVGAWVYGGGLRMKLGNEDLPLLLDTGVSYYDGGMTSYLREGGIQDNPDGTITISPLTSRTPFVVYRIGVKFRIPITSSGPCSRFIC